MGYIKPFFVALAVFSALSAGASFSASAQNKEESERYSKKYDQLVSVLGPAGVGIETVLDKWEACDPQNKKMLTARFNYYFAKSKTSSVVSKPGKKYLGNEPLFSLKDSTGNDIRYFEEVTYDDSLFSMALKDIDKAASFYKKDVGLRFNKAAALTAYEKESPDMALVCLERLVDEYYASPEGWTFDGEDIDREIFEGAIQEYCYTFFNIGTESSYNAFRSLAEKMLTKSPSSTMFLSDVGSYWLVAQKNPKKALKYYDKVLKISPKDYTAAKNCILIARKQKSAKLEKKYLPVLIEVSPDEKERMSAKARLEQL
ncbi:MAG: tetratricopeptide repeat protein [Candidatus Cryptobacteroides sp.]